MMKCEVEVCTTKANGYQGCDAQASHISRFGHVYCEHHASPSDLLMLEETQDQWGDRWDMRVQIGSEQPKEFYAPEPSETRCQRCGGDLAHSGVHCEPCVEEMTD